MRRFVYSLLLGLLGCGNLALEQALKAPDQEKFNQALKLHGPVEDGEVSGLVQAANGPDLVRARNATRLLTVSRSTKAGEALEKLGSSTTDLDIWSEATRSYLLREQLGHGSLPDSLKRADMARAGFKSNDAAIYQASIQIARRLQLPELQSELPKALHSKDTETVALAVASLTPYQIKEQLATLTACLKQSDYATFPAIALALIRSKDPQARQAVLKSFHEHDDDCQLAFVNEANFHMDPLLFDFLLERLDVPDEFGRQAFFMLVSQVIGETSPCPPKLMAAALEKLKKAGTRREEDSEQLVTVVAQGSNPSRHRVDWKKLMHGPEAIKFAQDWLRQHGPNKP